jgi:uncharacterized protein YjbI with pentapeptide repeats
MKLQRKPIVAALLATSLCILQGDALAKTQETESGCEGAPAKTARPAPEQLARTLKAHQEWLRQYASLNENKLYISINNRDDTNKAVLCHADLSNANLRWADLRGADLRGANLRNADLRQAQLMSADLRGANLSDADLREALIVDAHLNEADLSGADLRYAALHSADVLGANLAGAQFALTSQQLAGHPSELPTLRSLAHARNLSQVRIAPGLYSLSGFTWLRDQFKQKGLRGPERAVTAALKRTEARQSNWVERTFMYLAFDLTSEYGSSPGRPLQILFGTILAFSAPYALTSIKRHNPAPQSPARTTPKINDRSRNRSRRVILCLKRAYRRGGIWIVWQADRLLDRGRPWTPALSPTAECRRICTGASKAVLYGLYFSVLSAFHFGWRDLNVGNWIARIQSREYTLRATGWVRSVSGIQSLVSVYLIALWALTYFGRPFE